MTIDSDYHFDIEQLMEEINAHQYNKIPLAVLSCTGLI